MPPPPRTPLPKKSAHLSSSSGVRSRKIYGGPTSAVDTNVNTHSSTDPIKALGVLRRLLASLPTRIGGCQYKLTPAEHTLSLHLVSILDPFIYHGVRALAPNPVHNVLSSPTTGLIQQPTEILDAILFHVESRKDLLSAGLTCKRLHDVVFPRHFDYRVIRCKVSAISVWNHLILHKSLARNVRKLEIIDERTSVVASSNASHTQNISIPRGILQGDTDLESTDDELSMHAKQERYLAAALMRMTGLKEFKWSCIHSPISIKHVWPTLMMRSAGLKVMDICDNLVFAPVSDDHGDMSEGDESGDEAQGNVKSANNLMARMPSSSLLQMTNVVFRSTSHTYGAAKQPELARISSMLHQCINLKSLEITYIPPRSPVGTTGPHGSPSRTRPLADEFLLYSRWSTLTTLTLTNLRCASIIAPSTFLSAHPTLEILHVDLNILSGGFSTAGSLIDNTLPRLREIKASKEVINAILECPCDTRRPLESIKGFKLSGHNANPSSTISQTTTTSRSVTDAVFLSNLKTSASSVRRIELAGWHEMEDIRKLTTCVPNVQHLDIGKRLGVAAQRNVATVERGSGGGCSSNSNTSGPAANTIEWTELLATLPELTTMHGVKFFYEVASAPIGVLTSATDSLPAVNFGGIAHVAPSSSAQVKSSSHQHVSQLASKSMMERSRMRKNDEIAGVLAWKCKKLRRIDHWEEGGAKVIVLMRERDQGRGLEIDDVPGGKDKVRWEVRRVKH